MEYTRNYIENIPHEKVNIFIAIVLLLCFIVLFGMLLINKPDIVEGNFRLVSTNQPYTLTAPSTGEIIIITKESCEVNINQSLAYIKNTVSLDEISLLDSIINLNSYADIYKNINLLNSVEKLGELSQALGEFKLALFNLCNLETDRIYHINRVQIYTILQSIQQSNKIKNNLLNIEQKNLDIYNSEHQEYSILFSKNAIIKTNYNETHKNFLLQKERILQLQADIISLKQQEADAGSKLCLLELENKKNIENLNLAVINSLNILKANIESWKNTYLIRSPTNGLLEFSNFIETGHIVAKGMEVMKILPLDKTLKGLVYFPSQGANEIKNNSKVKLFLDSYSEFNDGYLVGNIYDISSSASINQEGVSFYWAKIEIDFNKQPFFKGQFRFVHDMTGKADIVVKDKRLILQIFNWLNNMLN